MKTQSAMSDLTSRGDDPVHCQCDSSVGYLHDVAGQPHTSSGLSIFATMTPFMASSPARFRHLSKALVFPRNNLAPTFVSNFYLTPTIDLTKHLFSFIFMQDSGFKLPQMRSHEND